MALRMPGCGVYKEKSGLKEGIREPLACRCLLN